ncbi:MAG: hypothetical protein ACT4PI_04705 [Actinomycetota bacterium]
MQAVIAFFFGLLFLAIAILGFVVFLSEGDAFGALFFSLGFLAGSAIWFFAAAHARGIKLGSLSEAWRVVFGRGSD